MVGFDFKNKTAYPCEVTTHLDGLLYVNANTTLERINKKYQKLKDYAKDFLFDFPKRHFILWSPIVRESIAIELKKIKGLELVINNDYSAHVKLLQELAKKVTHDTGNPAFRVLQILGHLRS